MALRPPRSAVSFSVVTKLKALLLVLGIAVLVVSGACLPLLHAFGEFGLWNEEHDLSLMAALGTAASQLDAMLVVGLVLALVVTLVVARPRAVIAVAFPPCPRAPPPRTLPRGPARHGTAAPGDVSRRAGASAPAVLALRATRRRPAPLRHRGHRRFRGQPHAVERRESPGRDVRRPGEPLLPARGRALALRPGGPVCVCRGSYRDRRGGAGPRTWCEARRGQRHAPHAAARNPGQVRPDAEPLRVLEHDPRARSPMDRSAQRA